jgi:hypothetical protein
MVVEIEELSFLLTCIPLINHVMLAAGKERGDVQFAVIGSSMLNLSFSTSMNGLS